MFQQYNVVNLSTGGYCCAWNYANRDTDIQSATKLSTGLYVPSRIDAIGPMSDFRMLTHSLVTLSTPSTWRRGL